MIISSSIWVDILVILVLIFFIHQGFVNGFWSILMDFLSFFGALVISLKTYSFAASLLLSTNLFTHALANAFGFLIMAIISEVLISLISGFVISKLPPKILQNDITKILGVILSFGQGVILVAFILTLAISLPISPNIKTDIAESKIGGFILSKTSGIEKGIDDIFGGTIGNSLTYLTIEPKNHESLPLDDQTQNLTVDISSETKMFQLVNKERTSRGIPALNPDSKLQAVARNYAKLMWEERFFGHYDPNGKDIGDRLNAANIPFEIAGENLALAPTVEIAHTGLMNSEGHRANILDTRFGKVGIGVIDNIFYGKMFVQVFTN